MSVRATELMGPWSSEMEQQKVAELRLWMNARDKHLVTRFFDDRSNMICYVNRLYESRVRCFYEMLVQVESISKIVEIIKCKQSVVSFGCGPGPEIAAYIGFVRAVLNCKTHILDITAVDCLEQWSTFIDVITQLDDYASIKFKTGTLNNDYLENMDHSDVCIMSYPHAMNFEDIWGNLSRKFSLIILIDQAKYNLIASVTNHGFKTVDFYCKGSKKFFYRIDENYDQRESTRIKCPRQLHDLHPSDFPCRRLVGLTLQCGHLILVPCFQDPQVSLRKRCTKMVKVPCRRNSHESWTICGSDQICQVVITTTLPCNHIYQFRCDETPSYGSPCMEMTVKYCQRGIHEIVLPCSSDLVCDEKVDVMLKCGHKYPFKCSEDHERVANVMKHQMIAEHTCDRQLHTFMSECGSSVRCEELIEVRQRCGHMIWSQCSEDERTILDGQKCLNEVVKTCNRGLHSETMLCSKPFICDVTIKVKLTCGHETFMKCCEDGAVINCKTLVVKKCRRNIHEHKEECQERNVCCVKYSIYQQCGCRRMVKCDDFESITNDLICKDDCKIKVKELFIGMVSISGFEHSEERCCYSCPKPCLKTLECGHKCQWSCHQCLNGRLHRPCIEKCTKALRCGHECSDYCHSDQCQNCSQRCWINKMKKFFQSEQKMETNDQLRWKAAIEPRDRDMFVDLEELFDQILFDTSNGRFSKKILEKYEFSLGNIRQLLDMYEVVATDVFPEVVGPYTEAIQRSILAMIRWINPSENMAFFTNPNDFNKEFARVKTLLMSCFVIRSLVERGHSGVLNEITDILREVMEKEYIEGSLTFYLNQIETISRNWEL